MTLHFNIHDFEFAKLEQKRKQNYYNEKNFTRQHLPSSSVIRRLPAGVCQSAALRATLSFALGARVSPFGIVSTYERIDLWGVARSATPGKSKLDV